MVKTKSFLVEKFGMTMYVRRLGGRKQRRFKNEINIKLKIQVESPLLPSPIVRLNTCHPEFILPANLNIIKDI
jgi:hypothetical protein